MKFPFQLLPVLLLLIAAPVQAAKFANQFTEFELPPNWNCQLEEAEWVCQSLDEAKKKEAIIVLAAKLKGEQDSLDQYLAYLKSVKSFTSVTGKPMKSEPKYAKFIVINGQNWVDSLHLESEIPGFYTRYLATVKDDIGVLITYSIAKPKYQEYLKDFDVMVNTLKVFRKPGDSINAARPADTNLFANTTPVDTGTVFPGVNVSGGSDQAPAQQAQGGMDPMTIGLIVVGAAALLLILKKKRGG